MHVHSIYRSPARQLTNPPTSLFGDVKARGIDIGPEGFNSLLALCGAQGQAARLADVFEYMRAKGVPLSEAAYVSVLRVKALGGAPEVSGWVDSGKRETRFNDWLIDVSAD